MRIAVLLTVGAVVSVATSDQWKSWKAMHAKTYISAAQERHRADVFYENLRALNASKDPTQGVTKYSDLSDEEFRNLYLRRTDPTDWGVREYWDGSCYACRRFPELAQFQGEEFDWTTKGAVTPVKTQHCGDCYAFGTTGDIEGVWFLAGHPLTPLSEEQIIDCCMADMGILDCAGCNGGNQEWALDWIVKKGGIDSESTYPYTVKPKGHPSDCKKSLLTNSSFAAHISGWYQVSSRCSCVQSVECTRVSR